jgi:hypothetical protein
MDKDETLDEFVQILGRIADLMGSATVSDDESANLDGFGDGFGR